MAEYRAGPWWQGIYYPALGEQFVQKIFNEQENNYPIIDNLSPESTGIRYRMADRGTWGTAKDIARFVAFNLFQTSLPQKVSVLGAEDSPEEQIKWDIARAREQGHQLFIAAMPPNDDLRTGLLEDSEQAKKVRLELDALAKDESRFPMKMLNCFVIRRRSWAILYAKRLNWGWLCCIPRTCIGRWH